MIRYDYNTSVQSYVNWTIEEPFSFLCCHFMYTYEKQIIKEIVLVARKLTSTLNYNFNGENPKGKITPTKTLSDGFMQF